MLKRSGSLPESHTKKPKKKTTNTSAIHARFGSRLHPVSSHRSASLGSAAPVAVYSPESEASPPDFLSIGVWWP